MVKNQLLWTNRLMQNCISFTIASVRILLKNALKIINDIIATVQIEIEYPEYYNPDKYKTENDGSYHAIEKHRCRVSYLYQKKFIRIYSIIHTGMEPYKTPPVSSCSSPWSAKNKLSFTVNNFIKRTIHYLKCVR